MMDYKNTVSSEKEPARRMESRLRHAYILCGCIVEATEGLGVIARNINSFQDGSGNDLYLPSPLVSTS